MSLGKRSLPFSVACVLQAPRPANDHLLGVWGQLDFLGVGSPKHTGSIRQKFWVIAPPLPTPPALGVEGNLFAATQIPPSLWEEQKALSILRDFT